MLGRPRRTTRLDVGLSLTFVGLTFRVWMLTAGLSRFMMSRLIQDPAVTADVVPNLTRIVRLFFVDTGFVIDVVGLGWMLIALALVFLASRQRVSISWAWAAAVLQALVAAVGGVLVGLAVFLPYPPQLDAQAETGALEKLSLISLPVVLAIAILIWVLFVVWMLVERARLDRRGPTLTDGLRSNR